MNEWNDPTLQRQSADDHQRFQTSLFKLAGSQLMLIACVCYLARMILSLVGGILAGSVAMDYVDQETASVAGPVFFVIMLIAAVVTGLYTYAFWRCYLGGRDRDEDRLIGGLKTLRVFITISLVMSCISVLSDLASIADSPLDLVETIFDIFFYIFLRKTVRILIDSVSFGSYDQQIPACAPVLLLVKVGVTILTTVVGWSELQTTALAVISVITILISLVAALCLAAVLLRFRQLRDSMLYRERLHIDE